MLSLKKKIVKNRSFRILRLWLSGIVLPGFQGVSLYDTLNFFGKEIFSQRFSVLARSVSFSFLMSLPPFLLFLFTLIPYLPFSDINLIHTIEETIGMVTQNDSLKSSVSELLNDFFLHKKEVLLSFSVLLTLFFSSNGMMGLMTSFDRNYVGFKARDSFRQRGIALLLTIAFNIVLILSFLLIIFQGWLFDHLGFTDIRFLGKLLQYLIIVGMLLFSISLIYKFGPSTESRWPFLTPGSIIATFLILIVTVLFFYMVNNLVNYNQIYGSVGTLIVFLVWLFTISQVILLGFELNVSIYVNKEKRRAKHITRF